MKSVISGNSNYVFQVDEIVAYSHKYRVPVNERSGRRGLQKPFEHDEHHSTPPPLLTLTHASHVATRPPGCNLREHHQVSNQTSK